VGVKLGWEGQGESWEAVWSTGRVWCAEMGALIILDRFTQTNVSGPIRLNECVGDYVLSENHPFTAASHRTLCLLFRAATSLTRFTGK